MQYKYRIINSSFNKLNESFITVDGVRVEYTLIDCLDEYGKRGYEIIDIMQEKKSLIYSKNSMTYTLKKLRY